MKDPNSKIFVKNIDQETYNQFLSCYSQDFVVDGALMPDAHSGYVAPIGSVLITRDFVVPSWVGYDIGCGMIAVKLNYKNLQELIEDKSSQIYEKVLEVVPMGKGKLGHIKDVSPQTKEEFKNLLSEFKSKKHNKEVLHFIKNKSLSHLGTLGSGNHFIELGISDTDDKNTAWIVIHSGSRGVGHTVATHYMKKASKSEKGFEQTSPLSVTSREGEEYLNVLNFGLDFALLNRIEMSFRVISVIEQVIGQKIVSELWANKNHNHAVFENNTFVHRKGATPAKKGERGVIPANMRDGCFLVEGLGSKKFLESSSHGAGRKMSRIQAKKEISFNEFKETMKGIVGNVSLETIDEAPFAYKDIYDVMDLQKESVKIISHIKPLINWKG